MGSVEQQLQQRREITLDLFTQWGPVWEAIRAAREAWSIKPMTRVPPEPPYRAEDVRLLTRGQMPERFHLPPLPADQVLENLGPDLPEYLQLHMSAAHRRLQGARWFESLRGLHTICVPDGNPSGTDVYGWMRWAPFLSACVLYDPPAGDLLTFADHDDQEAAQLDITTWHQDAASLLDTFTEATREGERLFRLHQEQEAQHVRRMRGWNDEADVVIEVQSIQHQAFELTIRHRDRLAATYKPSVVPPAPARPRGRPPLDDLTAVQCAIWKGAGWTHHAIAAAFGWQEHPDSTDPRHRKNRSEDHVKRGQQILNDRKYSG